MGIKSKKTRKAIVLFVVITFVMSPSAVCAKGGFDFYFMGINLKSFKGSNWVEIAAGAAASILTHELGHALYLESQGRDWSVEPSSSGFAVITTDSLTDKEYRSLGRAGYLLQTGIGFLLTSFDATANSDFTKGWTGINMVQTVTYKWRGHNGYDDFAMIDRGKGNGESAYRLFSSLSIYNFLKANTENKRIIFDVSDFQNKRRLTPGGYSTFQFNDPLDSMVFSMDTGISPTISPDSFAENVTPSPKRGERQST